MVYHNNVLAHWQSDEQRNMIADANLLPLYRSGFLLVFILFCWQRMRCLWSQPVTLQNVTDPGFDNGNPAGNLLPKPRIVKDVKDVKGARKGLQTFSNNERDDALHITQFADESHR